ncbi:MAG: hypothetical protein ACJ8F3_21175 [Xanthobacteraceae bacterium]
MLPLRPLFWYYQLMAKSSQKKASRKKGGRPATGRDPVFTIRLSSDLRQRIGAWAKKQRTAPSRSEAIRSLIEAGLAASLPVRKTSARGALKARELANQELERLGDKSLPPDEQQRRKQRLTKGPREFRELRDDLPRGKS